MRQYMHFQKEKHRQGLTSLLLNREHLTFGARGQQFDLSP